MDAPQWKLLAAAAEEGAEKPSAEAVRAARSEAPINAGTDPGVSPELSQIFTLRFRRVVTPGPGSCSATRPSSMV